MSYLDQRVTVLRVVFIPKLCGLVPRAKHSVWAILVTARHADDVDGVNVLTTTVFGWCIARRNHSRKQSGGGGRMSFLQVFDEGGDVTEALDGLFAK